MTEKNLTLDEVVTAFQGSILLGMENAAENFGYFALICWSVVADCCPVEDDSILQYILLVDEKEKSSRILHDLHEAGLMEDIGDGRFIPAFLSGMRNIIEKNQGAIVWGNYSSDKMAALS